MKSTDCVISWLNTNYFVIVVKLDHRIVVLFNLDEVSTLHFSNTTI